MRMNLKSAHRELLADPALLNRPEVFAFTRPWLHGMPSEERLFLCMRGDKYRIMSIDFANMERLAETGALLEELLAREDEREVGRGAESLFVALAGQTNPAGVYLAFQGQCLLIHTKIVIGRRDIILGQENLLYYWIRKISVWVTTTVFQISHLIVILLIWGVMLG